MFVGYRYCYHVNDPTIDHDIIKNVVQFTTANRYSLGSNFLNVDVLMSNSYDPANGATSGGAQEIYVTYRHQLSMNKAFKAGIKSKLVRDVALTVGADLNSKNTGFAPGKRMIVVGPTVNLNPKKGFADFGIWYYKEWTHNAFAAGGKKNVEFDGTVMFNLTWGIPIALTRTSARPSRASPTPPSRRGRTPSASRPRRRSSRGSPGSSTSARSLGVKKGSITMGPGYELWYHKFGNPSPIPVPGSTATKPNHTTSAPTFQAEIHF